MKAHAILSMLVVLAAAESATDDRFQRRRLTVSRIIRSIVAPFKGNGTVNSQEGRHGEWTSSTKNSRT